jgi:predicted transport protein
MSTLAAEVARVVEVAAAAKKLTEADTRAALIDPILDALGWDTRDLSQVRREVLVRGAGTTVDYALYSDGKAQLYVEAKKLGGSLDIKTANQTVNYANGAGVPWCVLTTGVRWQVFWTHAKVPIDRKKIFDIDLADGGATEADRTEALAQLALLARDRVEAGDLDDTGAALFDTAAVNGVLDRLFTDPPDELIALVAARLDHPVAADRVRAALVRVGRPFTDTPPSPPPPAATPKTPGSRKQGPRRPHTYDELFAGVPQATRDLYERFDAAVMAKDTRMTREFKAKAVNWSVGKGKGSIVVTAVPQANRLKLFLVLPGSRADGHADLRDVTTIGHHGHGDVEAALTPANFDARLALVDEALAAHAARA